MIIPTIINQKYENVENYLNFVSKYVRDVILRYCEVNGFAFVSRIKSVDSLAEKIESGRYKCWSELDDLFASAIVIPNLKYEEEVINFLKNSFKLVELRHRTRTWKNPEIFRFDSTRFIGQIKEKSLLTPNQNILNILFEIQIRSAFEHAWVVTTHDIAYKGPTIDWRILRLVSQLKASVEQLDALVLGISETSRFILEQFWPEVSIKKKIEEFFNNKFNTGEIPSEIKPLNWSRFCDNVYNLITASQNISNRRDLLKLSNKMIKILKNKIQELETEKFPRSISLFQFVLGIVIENEILEIPLKENYFPLITRQLIDLFPKVRDLKIKFDFDK